MRGFQCMLKLSFEEISDLFSPTSSLALFLIKTLQFCTNKQKTKALRQEFEIIKINGDHISFFCFALKYQTTKRKSIASLFHLTSHDCEFEKFSTTISTTKQICNDFHEKYATNDLLKTEIRHIFGKDTN